MGRHKYNIVGRDPEVQQILDLVVANRSVLVVGRQGYGKSRLLDEIARREEHKGIKLSPVYMEIQAHETPETIFEELLNGAYAYQQPHPIKMNHPLVRERFDRILTLFSGEFNWEAGKVSGSLGLAVGTIFQVIQALKARPEMPTEEKLLVLLEAISQPTDRRIVLVFDAVAEALQGQHTSWLRFVEAIRDRKLRVACVFSSRPDGPLMANDFCLSPLITVVPDTEGLQTLDEAATDDWAEQAIREDEKQPKDLQAGLRAKESEFKSKLRHYGGWPYPLTAAITLALSGEEVVSIPNDPLKVGEEMWRKLTPDAKKLMIAHLVLEVPAPPHVVQAVAELSPEVHNGLVNDRFVASLLPERDHSRALFHSLFAEEVAKQMASSGIDAKAYHQRAVEYFRERIEATRDSVPDVFAADRIVAHLLALGQSDAATATFVQECTPLLIRAGVFEPIISWTNELVQTDNLYLGNKSALFSNLGIALRILGELDGAEEMHRKSLAIDEELGIKDRMACDYINLGIVMMVRGDWDGAETMYRKSLAINEGLGFREAMATDYGNLGLIMQKRGDLDRAKEMFGMSLAINEELGRKEWKALDYGNLGIVMEKQGDLDEAEAMYRNSLALNEELGRKMGVANQYGNLGNLMHIQGNLNGAEEMYRKSLQINKELGRKDVMAHDYCNLGIAREKQGDIAGARDCWHEALKLFTLVGIPYMVEQIKAWLDSLPPA